MPTPSLSDMTKEQAAQFDAALRNLAANQAKQGLAPTSPNAQMQRQQLLEAFGIGRGAVPTREMGFTPSATPPMAGLPLPQPGPSAQMPPGAPPQGPAMGGPQAGRPPGAGQFPTPSYAQVLAAMDRGSEQEQRAILQDPRLAQVLNNPPQVSTAPARAQRAPAQLAWMKKGEAVDRATFLLQARMRPEKGEGKGKWNPFSNFPKDVQEEMKAALGYTPAGYWTGDVGKRERQLGNMLALKGAQEMQNVQPMAPSGARVPDAYALPEELEPGAK